MSNSAPDRNLRPRIHDIGNLTLEPAREVVLSNGITLHILDSGTAEVCRIGIALPGGTAESPRPALYRIVSQLLEEGTRDLPEGRVAEILEDNGAWHRTSVTTHHTLTEFYTLNSRFEALLPLIADIIFAPSFPEEAVERTLRQVASARAVALRKVSTRASEALRPLIYGEESPLAASALPEEVMAITREEIVSAHTALLDCSGTHIFLAGLVTPAMTESVVRVFGSIGSQARFAPAPLDMPVISLPREVTVDMPDALQSAVDIAIPVPGRMHPDFIKMRMATCALGGYFGSRLMSSIREDKGLTYGIQASLYGYPENGFLVVSTQTDCANTRMVLTETVSEIERLKNPATYSPDEIQRLSRHLLSGLAAILDSPFTRMDFLQNRVIASTPPDYFDLQQETVRHLDAGMLASAAEYFDTSLLQTAIAGRHG